jgi:hypothetical protein
MIKDSASADIERKNTNPTLKMIIAKSIITAIIIIDRRLEILTG